MPSGYIDAIGERGLQISNRLAKESPMEIGKVMHRNVQIIGPK